MTDVGDPEGYLDNLQDIATQSFLSERDDPDDAARVDAWLRAFYRQPYSYRREHQDLVESIRRADIRAEFATLGMSEPLLARAGDWGDERADAIARARGSMPDHPGLLQLLAENALEGRLERRTGAYAAVDPAHGRLLVDREALHPGPRGEWALRRCSPGGARPECVLHRECKVSKNGALSSCLEFYEKLIQTHCPSGEAGLR